MPGWAGSTRRARLPANWPAIRHAVMVRDNWQCQWPLTGRLCLEPATDCDHVDEDGPDELWNLRALCRPHHAYRSSQQGGLALGVIRRRMAAARRRPKDQHPGLLT